MLDPLWLPNRFFPILRRWFAKYAEELTVTRTRSSAEVAEWCKVQYTDPDKQLHQYLRIERRLGRLPAQVHGKFNLDRSERVPVY